MRVIIAGSRNYQDHEGLIAGIEASGFDIAEVVSGGARGADELGERWAIERGIPVVRFEANWDEHGKSAGPIRNGKMADYADALIAFPLTGSRGTADMIKQATRARLRVHVVEPLGHHCHANGCPADDCHPEAPFCAKHFKALHPAHQKRLWEGRAGDGKGCGVCCDDPDPEPEERPAVTAEWRELFNLAVAILLVLEYEGCGACSELSDEHGFCWGCGVGQASATYARAGKAADLLRLA